MYVKTLALIDIRRSSDGMINDFLLRDFPDSLIEFLKILGDLSNVLNRTTFSNEFIFDFWGPKILLNKLFSGKITILIKSSMR
jgi:hypothetical protein